MTSYSFPNAHFRTLVQFLLGVSFIDAMLGNVSYCFWVEVELFGLHGPQHEDCVIDPEMGES